MNRQSINYLCEKIYVAWFKNEKKKRLSSWMSIPLIRTHPRISPGQHVPSFLQKLLIWKHCLRLSFSASDGSLPSSKIKKMPWEDREKVLGLCHWAGPTHNRTLVWNDLIFITISCLSTPSVTLRTQCSHPLSSGQCSVVLTCVGFGVRGLRFEFWSCHVLAVWPEHVSYFPALSLGILTWE